MTKSEALEAAFATHDRLKMTSRRNSTFSERIKWLEAHPELQGKSRREIVDAMKRAGLIAISTYELDVRIFKEKGDDVPDRTSEED